MIQRQRQADVTNYGVLLRECTFDIRIELIQIKAILWEIVLCTRSTAMYAYKLRTMATGETFVPSMFNTM